MGLKEVTFATPAPDMSKRKIGKSGSPGIVRSGRPKRGAKDELMTVGWFHYVRLSLAEMTAGAVARRVQNYFDAKGLVTEHVRSKRWYRYRDGVESPDANTLRLVDELAPGSAVFFSNGPWDLWPLLWQSRSRRWDQDAAQRLFAVKGNDIDSVWLLGAVGMWMTRLDLAKAGAAENLLDGFYEAIHLALCRENLKKPLSELGVWDLLVATIRERERENLRFDLVKLGELEATALESGVADPLRTYLEDPVGFFHRVQANRGTDCLGASLYEIDERLKGVQQTLRGTRCATA